MCDVAERLEKMGIEKGIEIGRSEGEIKGKMYSDMQNWALETGWKRRHKEWI